jgi:hypothetical protein
VPLEEVARVQLSTTSTNERLGSHRLYGIRLWLDLPAEWIGNVLKVQYVSDDPSFSSRPKTSFDPSKSFEISYKAWRCAQTVKVIIFQRDGAQSEIAFSMCDAPEWDAIGEPMSPRRPR